MASGITLFGIFFLPIVLFWIFSWSKHLIPLLVFSSIFQAASIYNFNSFAISPYYFVSIIILFRFLVMLIVFDEKLYISNIKLKYVIISLIAFLGWAVLSSLVLPFIFEGISIFSPKEGIDEQYYYQSKLFWSMSNIAQDVYLLLNIINVFSFIQYVSNEENKKIVLKAFLFSAYVAIFMVLYHSLSKFIQIPFPEGFLYSNPFYSQGFEQRVGGLFRANGTFSEPSLASTYLVGITCSFFTFKINNCTSFQQFLMFLMSFLALLVTTATTGYVTFFIIMSILFMIKFFNIIYRFKVKIATLIKIVLLLFFTGLIFLIVINLDLLSSIESLTTSKNESDSFKHRIFSDLFAINIFLETYGFGVGLGSNRPSSYLTSLLSNLGVLGAGIMFYVIYVILQLTFKLRNNNEIRFFFLIFIATFISQIFSIPDLTLPFFWLNLGYLLAYLNYFSRKLIVQK